MTELELKYKSEGRCPKCGRPAREGFVICETCSKRASETKKLRADLRRKRGLCPQCGKLPIEKGKKLCYVCTGNNRDISALRRDEYRLKGLCIVCGQRKPPEGYATCDKCREYKARKAREAWHNKHKTEKAA